MFTEKHKFLLALIRSALGNNSVDLTYFKPDWKEIYSLAIKQGVYGVVFDSLEKLTPEMRPPKDILLKWIGNVTIMERTYNAYVRTIKELAELIKEEELSMLLMKGYGCSLNYPHPNHRPCGDIDIFVMSNEGKHNDSIVGLMNDSIIKKSRSRFIHDNDHHVVIQYGNFIIENHETILDINTHKSSIVLNELLEGLAKDIVEDKSLMDGLVLPSVRFNSIHLLRHMANDFATFKTTLRHVLDWSTFVNKNADDMDWSFVHKVAHESNMHKFLDAINGICVDYLGYNAKIFPIEKKDEGLRDRVLADILNPEFQDELPNMQSRLKYGWVKTCRMWRNRWKYRIVYDESLISSFLCLASNRIKRS